MFILMKINYNTASIFDTNDNTLENVNLNVLSKEILSNKLKVYGIKNMHKTRRTEDITVIPNLDIGIDQSEAKKALASFYQGKGYTREQAKKMVGM